MAIELIKALLVGVIAALPVGPVLLMVIQKTLRGGKAAGMMTGLGSAVGDSFLAAAGLLALGVIMEFVERHTGEIMIAGAILLAVVGVLMATKKAVPETKACAVSSSTDYLAYPLQSLAAVFSNPAAFAVMFGLLGVMGLGGDYRIAPVWAVLLCVFCGEMLYWTFVVFVLSKFLRLSSRNVMILNLAAGIVICGFAVFLLVKGIMVLF